MLPILFVGHGSPMNAIEDNRFVATFRDLTKTFRKPKAILCISAHWYTEGTWVTAMEHPRTIHDFGGFPKELYAINYPAPGNRALAEHVRALLAPHAVGFDLEWGLDHGTWTVLKHMYPNADVPVVQLSIDYNKPGVYHFELGKKLRKLRDEEVLVMGSGNLVHNLGLIDFQNYEKEDYGFDWAKEARETLNNLLLSGGIESLVQFEKLSDAVQLAIPTPEHYLPLLYVLGMKDAKERIELFNDVLVAGSLSMTGLKIG
ncbi:MAG TPA: 4,5-DOPA dioxygenase extradiol [Candidatus Paceibacterota bacterium]|nr:4,5-DOPA dioxygenase extradiol [Candidatus Paceibacterota bacterium]